MYLLPYWHSIEYTTPEFSEQRTTRMCPTAGYFYADVVLRSVYRVFIFIMTMKRTLSSYLQFKWLCYCCKIIALRTFFRIILPINSMFFWVLEDVGRMLDAHLVKAPANGITVSTRQ